jgi:predicted RND superfamily exporter protein
VKLFSDLIGTDYGAMSLAVIVFMLGMGVWYVRYFVNKMNEDAKKAGK